MSNPNYKLGIKNLTEKQMKTSLPSYSMLTDKIEKIRDESTKVDKDLIVSESFESLKYDHIFSILGGRGAGKTSILMTIHNNLKDQEQNIMLPIIMPELIDSDESIVSWLLSAMDNNLKIFEENIESYGYNKHSFDYKSFCDQYKLFERCIFKQDNLLRNKFERLKNAYYTKGYNTNRSNYDYSTATELKAQSVDNSFLLINMFTDYWCTLVEVYSKYLHYSSTDNNKDTNPLIFIFIDDADLKPQIINELTFIIPKYLSHPNVIVFVSASQKTLTYAVKNHMFQSITQNPLNLFDLMNIEYEYNGKSLIEGKNKTIKFHDLRYGREYDKISKLSDEILRKIFPVYNRLYLKKYDRYEEKGLLQVFTDDNSSCIDTEKISDRIAQLISKLYNDAMGLHEEQNKKIINNKHAEPTLETLQAKHDFLKLIRIPLEGEPSELGNNFYLCFLGRYPRDIMSVYYSLKEMLEELSITLENFYNENDLIIIDQMPLSFIEKIYEIVTKFINSAVVSNKNLSMFSREIRSMIKTQLLNWQLYVDYAKVLEIFKEPRYIEENRKNPGAFIEMICLLNFVEQLIVVIMPQRRKSHGYIELTELLKLCKIDIIQCDDDINAMFLQYYTFSSLNLIPEFDMHKREHQANFLHGAYKLHLIEKTRDIKYVKKYYEWFELLANVLFHRFNAIGRIYDYRNELMILNSTDFVDDNYDKLSVEYLSYLKLLFEDRPRQKKSDIGNSLYDMIMAISKLDEILIYINLKFDMDSEIDDILNNLDYTDDINIKKEVDIFIEYIKTVQILQREDFQNRLSTIEHIIEKNNDDYIFLRNWFRGFKIYLKKHVILEQDEDGIYANYISTLQYIKKHYKSYINYYYDIIHTKISLENSNLPYEYSNITTSRSLINNFNKIKMREWQRIMGMER